MEVEGAIDHKFKIQKRGQLTPKLAQNWGCSFAHPFLILGPGELTISEIYPAIYYYNLDLSKSYG
jgi:hypothetical protein